MDDQPENDEVSEEEERGARADPPRRRTAERGGGWWTRVGKNQQVALAVASLGALATILTAAIGVLPTLVSSESSEAESNPPSSLDQDAERPVIYDGTITIGHNKYEVDLDSPETLPGPGTLYVPQALPEGVLPEVGSRVVGGYEFEMVAAPGPGPRTVSTVPGIYVYGHGNVSAPLPSEPSFEFCAEAVGYSGDPIRMNEIFSGETWCLITSGNRYAYLRFQAVDTDSVVARIMVWD